MPKIKTNTKYQKKYKEEDIALALAAVEGGISKKRASVQFGVPRSTLQFRMSAKFTKVRHGPTTVLTTDEETLLVRWILESQRKGFPKRKDDIQASVKIFLDKTNKKTIFKNNLPGDQWYKSFLRRHPRISVRTPEGVTQSSACISSKDLLKWFNDIEVYLKEKGYFSILDDPRRVYNGDETCFLLNPKEGKVLASKGCRNVYEVDKGAAKANLTVMFTFSAAGDVTPPMIIYPYKRLPQSIADSVPKTWGIGLSDNGWMKSELFYEYVANVLHPYLEKSDVQFPIIYFVDGHKTHLTYHLSELCSKLGIILIALYPNSTRLIQPADVAAFKPIKNLWKRCVLEWRREEPVAQLSKEKFAPILKKVVDLVKPENIINGFRACGLCPWNPSALDLSKCLGKSKIQEVENNVLNFESFCDILGGDKINQLKNIELGNVQDAENDILYKLWKTFKTNNVGNNIGVSIGESNSENNDDHDIESRNLLASTSTYDIQANNSSILQNDVTVKSSLYRDSNMENNNITKSLNNNSVSYEYTRFISGITSENTSENSNPEISYNLSDIPIIVLPFNSDKNETVTSELQLNNDMIIEEVFVNEKVTDIDNLNILGGDNNQTNSTKFVDFLLWPQTPERKNKRNVERLPYVITSSGWKKIQDEKKITKQQQEQEKENKRNERLRKKENQVVISNARNRGKVSKKTVEKKQNNKTVNILSNVVVNNSRELTSKRFTTKEKHVRNLAGEEDANDFSISENPSGTANIEDTSACTKVQVADLEITSLNLKNSSTDGDILVTSGLCFICTRNINCINRGIKCLYCKRQFHKICLQKQKIFVKQFVCKTCSKA